VRPHRIIENLVNYNQHGVAIKLVTRHDLNLKVLANNLNSDEIGKYLENTLKIFCEMHKWTKWLGFTQQYESFLLCEGFRIEHY